jgi:predicted ATP-grasp superfamily ATP-dependent carboligase
MVEFRRGRDGVPYLLEINARFWGSLQLAIDAGMDFPHDLYRLARGESLSLAESRYQTGRRCRWLLGCLDHYYLRLKAGGGNDKGCPASNGTRPVGATGDFVFRWGDPLPFLWELRDYLGQLKGSGR